MSKWRKTYLHSWRVEWTRRYRGLSLLVRRERNGSHWWRVRHMEVNAAKGTGMSFKQCARLAEQAAKEVTMYRQMWRANPRDGVGIEISKEDDGYRWIVRELRPMMLEDDVWEGKASSLRQAKKEAETAARDPRKARQAHEKQSREEQYPWLFDKEAT